MARAKRKAVLIVTWNLEALSRGSKGGFCRHTKTHDKSHLGVRDLCTGRCSSKDLISSDKTGLDPDSITSFEFESVRDHRSITFNSTDLAFLFQEKKDLEIGYNCNRGRDRINLFCMTPIREDGPFCIVDFLCRCSS